MKRQSKETVHKDPVCGMELSHSSAVDLMEYDHKTYYFCSTDCKKAFEADPEKFIPRHRQHGIGPK